jgi:short-subunit dehydrogenase
MKTVLVTGASSGIGRATAIYLAQNGYKVFGAARRFEKMQDLKVHGITPIALDVTHEESMLATVEQILKATGRIDILVNNAGSGFYGSLEDVPMTDARHLMEVNLFGVARLTQLILPQMRKNKYGKIINISSIGGKVGLPLGVWYHSSKFAIEGMSDALRNEVKQFGIDVIVIEPGGTKSEMTGIGTDYVKRVSGDTIYKELTKGIVKMYTSMKGSEPLVIAKLIKKSIEAKHPKTRYVGGAMAKPMLLMRKLLSDKLFDKLIMSQMN